MGQEILRLAISDAPALNCLLKLSYALTLTVLTSQHGWSFPYTFPSRVGGAAAPPTLDLAPPLTEVSLH